MNDKPKIGLALGSGSARGMAHLGVLKALEEIGIDVDMVSGCSAGALIGGLYCSGISPNMIKGLAIEIDKKMWLDFTYPKKGIIKGDKIEEILKIITCSKKIEDLHKKLAIVATDLKSSQEVIFTEGPLYKAIRASISIPGIFEPVIYKGKVLVDGAVIDRVPISVLKNLGADIIIAVDVGYSRFNIRVTDIFDIIMQSLEVMSKSIMETDLIYADILIEPPLTHIEPSSFEAVEECSRIGYESTMAVKEQLINLIANYHRKST
ncbi:patatin-like phospholipase family protein [Tissierella sp. MSJ-40]|uniref:Patatin-like phospholipase family protein n=1 Tax=Tissierella simiarum TaxID=2841534 RepID=A0ABS6E4B0_9FIRM|nr:patatin-like phospholipase family protein [Tissierella simiarum]MBU5437744.1 patatin-like phospholipase family protein [Tissierella simiarum]